MGTGRTLNKKPRTRPVKSAGERKRRQKTQLKRLIGLGVPDAKAAKMNSRQVRQALQRPLKTKAAAAKAAAR
jgi:hypothetical protein